MENGTPDPVKMADKYCADVLAGRIVACKMIKLACRRRVDDLKRWGRRRSTAVKQGHPYYFSRLRARRGAGIYGICRHVKGEFRGEPIKLEPWEAFIVCEVFGWLQPDGRDERDDPRRYREVYITMARKNGKTTMVAPMGIYLLASDNEGGPEIYAAATTGDQARVLWTLAKKMVEKEQLLRKDIEPWTHHLTCEKNDGIFRPINSKSTSAEGFNVHGGLIDELHVHRTREMYDVITFGTSARLQPIVIVTTTAGANTESICHERYNYGRKVLEGTLVDDTMTAFIYELDGEDGKNKADDHFDEETWIKANPNLGICKQLSFMRKEARKAKASPSAESTFRRYDCNIWVTGHSPWLSVADWKACAEPELSIEDFGGYTAWIGGDLADKDDIASLVVALLDELDLLCWWEWHYLPEKAVERRPHGETAHYMKWVKQEYLTTTPGDFLDESIFEEKIRWLFEKSGLAIAGCRLDQYGPAVGMASRLNEDGLKTEIMAKNAKLFTNPAKDLEARVLAGKVRHTGNPAGAWMAGNCVVSRRVDGSILPKKESEHSTGKIDLIDALCLANSGLIPGEEDGPSIYESRGLLVI